MDPATDPRLLCTPNGKSKLPTGFFAEAGVSSEPSPKRRSTSGSTTAEVSPFMRANGVFLGPQFGGRLASEIEYDGIFAQGCARAL